MVHVSSTMRRVNNQPSNSTSCSDNALRLLVFLVGILYRGLQVTSSYSIWGCTLKGCFKRGIFWRAKSHLKGIEDFNLEHYTSHTKPRPVTNPLQALSLVEKVEPVQVRFTLHLREQRSMRVQNRWKVYVDSYMACKWIMFHGHLDYFQKPPLACRPNTKPLGDHGVPKSHIRWFILFYHVWGPAWTYIHWYNVWLRAQSHRTLH